MEGYELVTQGFEASYQVETGDFIVRKLTVNEVEKDYKAVCLQRKA